MAESCCGTEKVFDGSDPRFLRVLWAIIAINAAMFCTEVFAGHQASSQSLWADALDFAADAMTYAISLWAIGKSQIIRDRAALLKGVSLLVMAIWVLGSTIYKVIIFQTIPDAPVMGIISVLAFAANMLSVILLYRWRNGDANVRSVWLCSRNDAIGNVAVMLAAVGVFGTGTAWPDLIVAGIMASLFARSAWQIIRQAIK